MSEKKSYETFYGEEIEKVRNANIKVFEEIRDYFKQDKGPVLGVVKRPSLFERFKRRCSIFRKSDKG